MPHRQDLPHSWLLETLMSKKWKQMTKNEKLDLLRDEVDKLKRRIADAARSPTTPKMDGKKTKEDDKPFSS